MKIEGPVRRELLPSGVARRKGTAKAAPSGEPFDYPAVWVGKAGNVAVYSATALGSAGTGLAAQLVKSVARPYDALEKLFATAGGSVSVILSPLSSRNDGSGGAYHYGCDFATGGDLYVDAAFGARAADPLSLDLGLYVAELAESFMGGQGKGWGCGFSNGEALSRFCAEQATPPGTMDAFDTGPAWDGAGRPDWINRTEQTDTDAVSTGCGVVYLYWLRSLGAPPARIIQAGGATLAANYQVLTGKLTAYKDLLGALKGVTIRSDNPFGGQ